MSKILKGITGDTEYSNNSSNKKLTEGISQEDLANTLFYRLERFYPDVVSIYGHERVGDTVLDVASFHAGVEELGTSDISIMVKEVLRNLEKFPIDENKSNVTSSARDLLLQARKITSEYRYADMHLSIISKIQTLAESSSIDKNDLEYLINQVYEKQRELESAIFALDEPFEEAARREEWNDNVDEGQIYAQGGGYGEARRWYTPKDNLGESKEVNENLRKWFKEKWVRFGPDGKIRGACARGDDSEGKPKCLPQSKAHSLGKKGRASAAARKRREDPNPERSGKAINVATKKKSNEGVAEGLDNIPATLYHATYRPLLKSIRQHGLGGDKAQAKWEDSKPGVVYLALNKDVAESYAETSDVVPDEWLDEIVVLKISTNGLDAAKFHLDTNVLDNEGDTVEYHGVIPVNNIKMIKQGVAEAQLDELKCWPGYTRVKGVPAGAPGSCKKKTSEDQAPMFTPEEKCPECGGPMFSELLINEKKDACYYKVKSRYKVWPSAYASGALVKCRKKGADSWGTGGKKNEGMVMGASSDASSAGTRVQGEAANPAQQAAIAIAMKKAGQKPKRESAIMKGLVDETLGTPYPGTYEQETAPFRRKGPKRMGDLTNE